jgi:hypothetical protein
MRSSKSRSRSKANRPRSLGNIVNRVFDSSGPEGKVRGTPQQIIEKYLVLARDAQLSNDRVAAENFLQHAEHYTRMLGEAMRESQREAESRRDNGNPNGNPGGSEQRPAHQSHRHDDRGRRGEDGQRGSEAAPVIDFEDSGPALVETPEARRGGPEGAPQGAERSSVRPQPEASSDPAPGAQSDAQPGAATDAPAAAADKPAPRRRAPRRPRGAAKETGDGETPRSSAAE